MCAGRTRGAEATPLAGALPTAPEPRRGVILMVVLILLTLFAIVGLSFALYASSEAQSSQLFREGQMSPVPDVDPESLFDYFMNQLLYDTDDVAGINSALRGHSLARTMYGYNYKRFRPDLGSVDDPSYVVPNTIPFNGLGRLHGNTNPFGSAVDDYSLISYKFFSSDGFLRDPERQGARNGPLQLPGNYLGGFNTPYTYPDLNNMFLAAVRADGTVLMPSYHRPWLFGSLMNRNNPNWTNPQGKYMTLRPRPVDMSPLFPYPEDEGGDVKNLIGSPGYLDPSGRLWNNDSIWVDLGYPVITTPDGRKFKPLFAALTEDLDNRVNINVQGNIRGTDPKTKRPIHLSNQGWGPWEVNLSQVLNGDSIGANIAANPPVEWTNLLGGLKDPNEPQQLIQRGRYGFQDERGQLTSPHPHAPWVPNISLIPHSPANFYSPMDFDAAPPNIGLHNSTGRSGPIMLPPNDGKSFTCFPSYPVDYQGNSQQGLVNETTAHPLLYDYFQPTADDRRRFLSSNMEALLRYSDTGSLALTSDLFRLCPMNFSGAGAERRRNLVTTNSFDLDRPGVMPWAYPVAPGAPGSYRLQPGQLFPNSTVANSLPVNPQINKGEYGPDGRAGDAFFGRVDLNRDLPPYPPPTDNGRIDLTNQQVLLQFNLAQSARQQLAKDIFDRLRYVTTGDTRDVTVAVKPTSAPEFNAMRWLAQLAVNIVDYIDADDYMTPFNWYPPYQGNSLGEWVYGTELPRLVLNEAYIEYDNDPSDTGTPARTAQLPGWVNFWVELYNPFRRDPNLPDPVSPKDPTLWSAARLRMPQGNGGKAYGIYQLLIAKEPDPGMTLQQPGNTLGNPPFPAQGAVAQPGQVVRAVSDFSLPSADPTKPAMQDVVRASDPAQYAGAPGQNINGFYVLGPNYAPGFPGAPQLFETLKVQESVIGSVTNSMTYKLPPPANILTGQYLKSLPSYGLFLQRLACPHLPPNPPAGSPPNTPPMQGMPYNPYITIDYLDAVQAYDGVRFSSDEAGGHKAPAVTQRFSWGRRQPYAANKFEQMAQRPSPPLFNQPQNTFFRHNGETNPFSGTSKTLSYPFDWLIHLDRPLISPLELLNVSAYKPHELTHQFILNPGGIAAAGAEKRFQHRLGLIASNPQSRIYRVFECLEAGNNRAMGTAAGGRVPGKININTIWDLETLAALCDPQPANLFTAGNPKLVQNLFAAITQSRTPTTGQGGVPIFGANDKPFRGMATPFSTGTAVKDSQYPAGAGISDTLLRNTADNSQLLFAVPQTQNSNPFLQYELLNKIYNHLTTRSNVFAVWLTVGFFEVVQDTDAQGNPIRPVKLGAEIGKAEGRNIRHRMFAIVDRTNLSTLANVMQLPKDILASPQSGPQTVQLPSLAGITSSPPFPVPWSIRQGTAITIEDPVNPETVVVENVPDPNIRQIVANFKASHRRGTWVSLADTPGPPPIFIPSLPLAGFMGIPAPTKSGDTPPSVPILATYTKDPSTGQGVLTGTYEDLPWSIRPNDLLVVDSGPNEEVVQVISVSQTYPNPAPSDPAPPSFQARFTKPHPGPLTIRFPNARPGNPGPQPRFNPHDPVSAPIVRYFNIIE